MNRLKKFLQRFRGGPDFNHCIELTAALEDILLTVSLPMSNIQAKQTPKPVNFPYSQAGWFEANAKNSRQHHQVHVNTKIWYYIPKGFLLNFSELGMLSASIYIKRIPSEKKINAIDLNDLGRHLIQEYDEFYNAPEFGENWLGENTRIAHETRVECERNTNLSNERIEEEIEKDLASRGFPPIQPHIIKTINELDWVFYVEPQVRTLNKDNLYCLPLNKDYYLTVQFRYRVDISPKFKLWKEHAEAAEQRIMESVKLEKIANQQLLENAG